MKDIPLCCARYASHEHILVYPRCRGDTPQLAPREADFQRDTQDNKSALFKTRRPSSLGGTLLEEAGDDWMN